ncbi:hypothetical protein [Streptomyces alkaliterrae]|uniref:DUF2269 domain-containing protein n=1 Tax=Streptomyces alkaliterrae TaxID=2213162 RepID=A0A5P0YUL0_9ACTN|nr:hypothetical protein [Streptomyces alkaliterrae]MBB1261722.1 hypothetical protein [Streptomyces alkaliterrae]MQS03978.1 hypothetical protein [Streptomyces alkaliterrae]
MALTPRWRRVALTVHIAASVGWLGAVAAFLALAAAGLRGDDDARTRGLYAAAEVLTWWVIVPLALASLVTGVVQALGTPWGLLRHYWVVAKLGLTVLAVGLLLLHTRPVGQLAAASALDGSLEGLRVQLVVDAAAGLVLLAVITMLSVFQPRGLTPYGWRRSRRAGTAEEAGRGTGHRR